MLSKDVFKQESQMVIILDKKMKNYIENKSLFKINKSYVLGIVNEQTNEIFVLFNRCFGL